jgi:hypothetical protein
MPRSSVERGLALARGDHAAVAGSAFEVKAARALLVHQAVAELGVGLRDDIAVFVLGDGEQPVHVFDVLHANADRGGHLGAVLAEDLTLSHVPTHRREPAEHVADHLAVTGAEQVREIVNRDPQRVDQLDRLIPRRAYKPALTTLTAIQPRLLRMLDDL